MVLMQIKNTKHHITWIDIAFLFESSWLPANIKHLIKNQ